MLHSFFIDLHPSSQLLRELDFLYLDHKLGLRDYQDYSKEIKLDIFSMVVSDVSLEYLRTKKQKTEWPKRLSVAQYNIVITVSERSFTKSSVYTVCSKRHYILCLDYKPVLHVDTPNGVHFICRICH